MLYCDYDNDSWIRMGSGENHINVSLLVRDKVTIRPGTQTTTQRFFCLPV